MDQSEGLLFLKQTNGAIDSNGIYTLPDHASKNSEYTCPDSTCGRKVFLKKGPIKRPHFCHYSSTTPCRFYESVGESADHKNGKLLLRNVLETKRDIQITQSCAECFTKTTYTVPTDVTDIREEYPLEQGRRADVGCKLTDSSLLLLEVFHTSKTHESNRSGRWFEFRTDHLFEVYKPIGPLVFHCCRTITCQACEQAKEERRKQYLREQERLREERALQEARREEQRKQEAIQESLRQKRLNEETRLRREAMKRRNDEWREAMRLKEIEREEQYKKEESIRQIAEEERKKVLAQKEQERIERERIYEDIRLEYLRVYVEPHVYDPKLQHPETVQYKGFEFLHPNHTKRLMMKQSR